MQVESLETRIRTVGGARSHRLDVATVMSHEGRSRGFRRAAVRTLLVAGAALSLIAIETKARTPPEVVIRRLETPPRIDGRVEPGEWDEAARIDGFLQVDPVEGAPPSEKTEVFLGYDDDVVYIAYICHDSDPESVITTTRERDARLDPDDRIEFILDTFDDRRNAFFFQINAGGAKGDALITNNGRDFNKPWDGIFEARASVTERGWEAEFALPAKTLRFSPAKDSWGFNTTRYIKRKRELVRWANPTRDQSLFRISSAGRIRGLSGLDQGIGIDFKPFVVTQALRDRSRDRIDRDFDIEPGFDLSYQVTPGLKAILTVNTDFAETETDDVRVNLTRFPLFFPEKRDFFLEDAGIFSFANSDTSLIPFFSRRIGIANGDEVPILAGLKLSGRVEDYAIGVLDVQTEATGDLDSKNLLAARVTKNVLEQSTVGAIVTRGNPAAPGSNALAGIDFNYRTSDFLEDRNLEAGAFVLATSTSGEGGDDSAWGVSFGTPNDFLRTSATATIIGSQFNPALGFVPRRGIRRYTGELLVRPRPDSEVVRQFDFGILPLWITDSGNTTESRELTIRPLGITFESEDRVEVEILPVFERLDEPFRIFEGIEIPADAYDFTLYRLEIETSDARPVAARTEIRYGEFFTGRRNDLTIGLDFRPDPIAAVTLEYVQNDVSLDEGSFVARIGRFRMQNDFTPRLGLSSLVQFDNVSDTLGLNSRLRWIIESGSEIFFVVNQGWQREGSTITSLATELSLKIGWTVRF